MTYGELIGAVDVGTSSVRFMIFSAGTDNILCYDQQDVPQIYPQEGWVEEDPLVILSILESCMENALAKLEDFGASRKDIIAVGITNQRESVVVWDRKTGTPLYNAIIWLDNRTASTVSELLQKIPSSNRNINYLTPLCGLPLSPYFSALKLRWLKDNVAVVRKAMLENTCLFGTIDSWVIYFLSGGSNNGGVHVTDVTNASRTMLMNLETLKWDENLLNFFELPKQILPQICSSAEVYGEIKLKCLPNVPIAACLGDQQAAVVGHQCLRIGQAKSTYGTGCFLLYNTGHSIVYSRHGLLTTVAYQLGKNERPVYALEGSVAIAGAAFRWLRENLGLIKNYEQIEPMARSVDNSLDVYFVPAFSGLYAPYWNQEARGVICGLSEETTSEHIVRATLESVCFQVRDILDSMKKDCGVSLTKLMVDGGMIDNSLLLQLQSDLVGITVIRPKVAETTSLGAALAAFKTMRPSFNIESSLSSATGIITYKPKINDYERDKRYKKWLMAVERAIGWDISTNTGAKSKLFT